MAQDSVKYKMVVIGGSAGCLNVILEIIKSLPANAGAAYVVIVHRKNSGDSILSNLINDRTDMDVKEVEDKEPLFPDTIYLAPSDYHLLVDDENTFSLDSSEKVNYSRPSIDVTFEAVAEVFREKTIGILLSGANADGAAGLVRIRQLGGFTIVQDPETADVSYMPEQAIQLQAPERILKPEDIIKCVGQLLQATVE